MRNRACGFSWLRLCTVSVLALLALTGFGSPHPTTSSAADPGGTRSATMAGDAATSSRVSGATRVETAVTAARQAFPEGATTALVARGDAFPDALAAAPLAGALDAPVLLADGSGLPKQVGRVLRDLGVQEVIVLGGRRALDGGVEGALENALSGVEVERVSGKDRYATAASMARAMPNRTEAGGSRTAFVANGESFPDALAAGPLAFAEQMPLLLTPQGRLHQAAQAAIADLGIERVVLLGGRAAVSEDVESSLAGLGLDVQRIGGAGRVDTAVNLADYAQRGGLDSPVAVLARGDDFPDALVAAPYSGRMGAPILLTANPSEPGARVTEWLMDHCEEIEELHAMGGKNAIGDAVLEAAERAAGCAAEDPEDTGRIDPDVPSSGDVPHGEEIGLHNTGPRSGDLPASGSIVTERDGQVIEGLRINGTIEVRHSDVVIRDVEIVNGGSNYSIWSNGGRGKGTRIEWVAIDGSGNTERRGIALDGDTTVYRTSVVGHTNAGIIRSGDRWIESYSGDRVDEVENSDSHGSGLGAHGASDIQVVRSNLGGVRYGSSALSLYPRVAPIQDALIKDNLFNGGSFCLYAGDTSNHPHRGENRNIQIIGNKFGSQFFDGCGQYGPVTAWNGSRPGNEWKNNTWQDGGAPVGP